MAEPADWPREPLAESSADLLVFVLLAAGFLFGVFACAWRALRSCRRGSTWFFRRLWDVGDEDPEVQRLVKHRLLELRARHFSKAVQVVGFIFLYVTGQLLLIIAGRKERFYPYQMELMHSIAQGYMAIIMARPQLVTANNLDAHFALIILGMMAGVSPFAGPTVASIMGASAIVVGLDFARGTTSRCRMPLFMILNCLFASSAALSLLRLGRERHGEKASAWYWCFVEIVGMIAFCLAVHLLEKQLYKAVLQGLRLQETKELHTAACALLRSSCQVVVELGPDRRILSPEPDLGSYLLRDGQCLKGTLLDDLLASDSKRPLESLGQQPRQEALGLADTLKVNLKDGWGRSVPVELLWFRFQRLDGQANFMLGVRDLGEGCTKPSPEQNDNFKEEQGDSSTFDMSQTGGDYEASLVVNCCREGLPIVSMTFGFCTEVGRLPAGTRLLHHVRKPRQFYEHLQEGVNEVVNDGDCSEQEQFPVTFRMPQGKVKVLCTVGAVEKEGEHVTLRFIAASRDDSSSEDSTGPTDTKGTPASLSRDSKRALHGNMSL